MKRYVDYTKIGAVDLPNVNNAYAGVNIILPHYPQPRGYVDRGSYMTASTMTPPDKEINPVWTTPMSFLNPCFHARRGSTRWMLSPISSFSEQSPNTTIDLTICRGAPVVASGRPGTCGMAYNGYVIADGELGGGYLNYDTMTGVEAIASRGMLSRGGQIFSTSTGVPATVESPYYNNQRFHASCGEGVLSGETNPDEFYPSLDGSFIKGTVSGVPHNNPNFGMHVRSSVGEDFSFNFWTGVPKMYRLRPASADDWELDPAPLGDFVSVLFPI